VEPTAVAAVFDDLIGGTDTGQSAADDQNICLYISVEGWECRNRHLIIP